MWRSRARLGLCAIVVALAWPAVPAIAVAGVAQPDAGTLQVSPATVQASAQTPLTLSFTAPAIPAAGSAVSGCHLLDAARLDRNSAVFLGLGLPELRLFAAGCFQHAVRGRVELSLKVPTTLTLSIQATPPWFATSSTFTAAEQLAGLPFAGTAPVMVTAPPVTVTCPQGGLGTMIVNPSSEPAATSMTYTFTYQAGSCGAGPGGVVTVTVPPNWTSPSANSGTPGFVTWTGTPQALAQGSMIVVPVGNLEPGTTVTFEYEAAQDPGSAGPYTFDAGQAAAGEPSQSLVSSPTVTVTPVVVTSHDAARERRRDHHDSAPDQPGHHHDSAPDQPGHHHDGAPEQPGHHHDGAPEQPGHHHGGVPDGRPRILASTGGRSCWWCSVSSWSPARPGWPPSVRCAGAGTGRPRGTSAPCRGPDRRRRWPSVTPGTARR